MTNDERLTLRARQLMDEDGLSNNQRIANAPALLMQLALSTQTVAMRDAVLAEVRDPDVRTRLAAALDALVVPR